MQCVICGCTEENGCQLGNGDRCSWAILTGRDEGMVLCNNSACLKAYAEQHGDSVDLVVGVSVNAVVLEVSDATTQLLPEHAREVARALMRAADVVEARQREQLCDPHGNPLVVQ